MRLANLTEKYSAFKKIVKLIGLRRFLMRMIYSSHVDIIGKKELTGISKVSEGYFEKFHLIDNGDIPRLVEFYKKNNCGGSDPLFSVKQYLSKGCFGYIAEQQGEIVGYVWCGNDKTNFDFALVNHQYYLDEMNLTATDVYAFDFFLSPDKRGHSAGIKFLKEFFVVLVNAGFDTLYYYVRSNNKPARLIYKITGGQDVKKVVVRRLFMHFLFINSKFHYDGEGRDWLFKTHGIFVYKKKVFIS
jgi:hypothetical protein